MSYPRNQNTCHKEPLEGKGNSARVDHQPPLLKPPSHFVNESRVGISNYTMTYYKDTGNPGCKRSTKHTGWSNIKTNLLLYIKLFLI